MSLRDFNAPTEERTVILHHEPIGNGAGLSEFHTVQPEDREPNNTGKIVGALAVALMLGGAGLYFYTSSSPAEHQATMTAANTPAPPPVQPAAMTPPPAPETLAEAAPVAPAADVMPAPAAPAPIRSARVAPATPPAAVEAPMSDAQSVRMGANAQSTDTSANQQQAAVTAVPEPVSPTPPASDVAIANPQSSLAISPDATTAQDIPAPAQTEAMPPAEAASPAQAQPEQAAGQVSQ